MSISQVQNVVWLPAGLPALFFVLDEGVSDEGACSFPPDTLGASEEEEKIGEEEEGKGEKEEEKEEDDILVLRSGDAPTEREFELEESICEKFIKLEGVLTYSI